ncbi:MAG: hypothetical protein ACI8W3_001423 [Myxococcota bacterium]|jgi:hypothetical protein
MTELSQDFPKHLLFTSARPEAFARMTRTILGRLGYGIVTSEELALYARRFGDTLPPVEMLLLDEHRTKVPEQVDPDQSLPVVLLTGRAGIRSPEARIMAAVKRPAGLHDLYRIFQRHFEEVPRSTPRIETELNVTCHRGGKTWSASVVSLSDNGCLLRGPEAVPLGARVDLTLDLPHVGAVELEAESAYQLVPDLGLVFSAIRPEVRDTIGNYVIDTLAAS